MSQPRYNKVPEKYAWSFLKKYPKGVAAEILVDPIVAVFYGLFPWIISRVVDMVNSGADKEVVWQNITQYFWLVIGLVVAAFFVNVFGGLYSYFKLSADASVDAKKDLLSSILPQSFSFFNKNPAGNLASRYGMLGRGVSLDGGLMGGYSAAYARFSHMVVVLYFVGVIYLPLAFVMFFFACFLTYFLSASSKSVEEASKEYSKTKADTFGKMVDACTNYFLIKVFGTKQKEHDIFYKDLGILETAQKQYDKKFLNHTVCQQALSLCLQIALILYAVFLWVNKVISVGDVIYIMTTLVGLMLSFRMLGYIILGVKENRGSMKFAIDVFNEPYDIVGGEKTLKVKGGAIEIKNLSFSYDGKKSVLKNINLTIAPKEKIGIVGVSGGGKTTLIHLLQRIYNYNKGEVLIDGQNIKDVSLESLYKNVAFIPQDTSLFHRSIKENVSYGKFNASAKKIKEITKHSYVDEFIEKLPDGYDTLVGDKGVKLSGGQRQRVGIARAIIKDAPILLLDEATSALDSKSEKYIQKAIKDIIKDKTVIAVAHRLSTLRDMDRIVVIDNGKIIEEGSPKKLLDKKGKFAKLWHIQMD